jgi:Ca2+-binding EF-hand superfamily protein
LSKAECRNYVIDLLSRLGEEPKVSEEEFSEIFTAYDQDGNGVVTKQEMEHVIRMARGEEAIPKKLTPEEITAQIWAEYDKDGNGTLSKAECRNYVNELLSRLGEEPKVSEEEFNEIFKAYDQDGKGVVTKDEMEHVIRMARGQEAIPKQLTPEEITA